MGEKVSRPCTDQSSFKRHRALFQSRTLAVKPQDSGLVGVSPARVDVLVVNLRTLLDDVHERHRMTATEFVVLLQTTRR